MKMNAVAIVVSLLAAIAFMAAPSAAARFRPTYDDHHLLLPIFRGEQGVTSLKDDTQIPCDACGECLNTAPNVCRCFDVKPKCPADCPDMFCTEWPLPGPMTPTLGYICRDRAIYDCKSGQPTPPSPPPMPTPPPPISA